MKGHFVPMLLVLTLGLLPTAHAATRMSSHTIRTRLQLSRTRQVTATVITTPLPKDYLYRRRTMWGGDRGESARRIITRIGVRVGKAPQYLPLSAYADLGDPTRVYLQPLPKAHFRLVIHGSDAGGAYTAYFYFRQGNLVHRKVVSGEFPSEVWEDTRYGFIPSNSRL